MDPYVFIDAIAGSIRQLKDERKTQLLGVQKMVFCTQWKGLIAVNEDGHVLYDAMLWLDKRAEEQADRLNAAMGREVLSSADCISKIVWLRDNHRDIYSDTYKFLEINAFLKWFATGVMVIDETGHYAKSFSKETQATLDSVLKIAGIPESKIPGIVRSDEHVGTLTHRAAAAWGLESGIEVFGGLTDIAAIALGSSAAGISDSHLYFGSSGWLGTVVDGKDASTCPRVAPFIGNTVIRLDGLEAVGLARAWVLDLLFAEEHMGEEERDAWLEASLEGIDGSRSQLLSIPLIFKEHPPMPSDVFAVFWGMRASDT
jgi:xylulokinase